MEKKYIRPNILAKHKVSGVYKITFDGTSYYIGSSVNVAARFIQWKTRCENGIFKNCNVRRVFPDAKEIKFEIINRLPPDQIKAEEDRLIKQCWGDPQLLNRSSSAFGSENIIRTEEQQAFLDGVIEKFGKKVAQFDCNGALLRIFKSKSEAARELKVHHSEIRRAVKHIEMRVRGYLFKLVNADGSYVENPVPQAKKGFI